MLEEVLRHSRMEGATTKLINLATAHLNFCTGSYSELPALCNLEACIGDDFGDSFSSIVWELLEADAVVFATPVYWYGPSALLKVLIERMTSLENMGAFMLRGKVAGIVVVGEEGGAIMAASSLLITLTHMGFAIPPLGVAYMLRRWDDSRKTEALEDAAALGHNVVRMAEMLGEHPWDWIDGWRGNS